MLRIAIIMATKYNVDNFLTNLIMNREISFNFLFCYKGQGVDVHR